MATEAGEDDGEIPGWWVPYAPEFPGWQPWQGVTGLFYVRRVRSSPPVVIRRKTPAGLARAVERWLGRPA